MMIIPHRTHIDHTEWATVAHSASHTSPSIGGQHLESSPPPGGGARATFQVGFRSVSGRFQVGFRSVSGGFHPDFRPISCPFQAHSATLVTERSEARTGTQRKTIFFVSSAVPRFPVFLRVSPVSHLPLTCLAPVSGGYDCR